MKRTFEVILSIIGVLAYGLVAILGGAMIWLQTNEDSMRSAIEEASQTNSSADIAELNAIVTGLGVGGWVVTIAAVLAILAGIAAAFFLKGNRNPKLAGIILVATAIIGSILTLGVGIIPGVFYLIAGIMCFARKPYQLLAE